MIKLLELEEIRFSSRPATPRITEPLSYREIVEITCAPYNAAVVRVWDEYVAATRLAVDYNLTASAYTIRAVRYADSAVQHLTLALLAAPKGLSQVPIII